MNEELMLGICALLPILAVVLAIKAWRTLDEN